MLYAQALSTPSPSILQGFQSGKGKRPATTKASSGSSACNFSCSNESYKHKSTIIITITLNQKCTGTVSLHLNYRLTDSSEDFVLVFTMLKNGFILRLLLTNKFKHV